MTTKTITPAITEAESALDEFRREAFPRYHSITEGSWYSLETIVSREFDVAELMTGLGVQVDPAYKYRTSPLVEDSVREDYEAAHAMATAPDYWEKLELSDWPEIVAEFGEESTRNAICIHMDSPVMGELLSDYFALESVSKTDAEAKLSEYMRLLDAADRAYREAGWEL